MSVLYGLRLARLAPLGANGKLPATPEWEVIESPQQAQIQPQVITGQQQEIRGGDKLLATVQEDDQYVGIDLTFQDAVLSGEVMALIAGGTFEDGEYEPPAIGAPRTGFAMELYVAQYEEGSNHESDLIGYAVFEFPNCKGTLASFTAQGQNFLVPSYTIRARDNKAEEKRFMKFKEFMKSLPDEST